MASMYIALSSGRRSGIHSGRLSEDTGGTSGVPQIAAYLCNATCRRPRAKTGREQPQQTAAIKSGAGDLLFSPRKRLSDLAGLFDEQPRDWAECAVFQRNDSNRRTGLWQFNWQDL